MLDAGALLEGEKPHEAVLRKLALLAESEAAQVVIRSASSSLQQFVADTLAAHGLRLPVRYAAREESLRDLLAKAAVPASECLLLLADDAAALPAGSHAFYVGSGTPPAGAVASRVPGPRGTDALLALYGTALIQEKAGLAFRAASQGASVPVAASFDAGLFEGLIKSYGRFAGDAPAPPAPDLDGQMLRELAGKCFSRVLRNIQPNGAIVASPAKGDQPGEPNYWFVWQRDAGHTLLNLISWSRSAPFGLPTEPMEQAINSYLGFLTRCQASRNLGVSRYTVEEQPVTGYGNPQLDGPAISVLAMTNLLDPRPVYPQIRALLEYLLTPEGQGPCYDAWEFVYGRILNALLLKRKAFRAAARLASVLTEQKDMRRYQDEAARLEAEIEAFVDPQRGYLVGSREPANPWLAEISGLDVATLGAILTAWESNDNFFNLTDPAVVGTVLTLEDAFAPLYAVNRSWLAGGNAGMGWGRFPEDANDGLGSTGGNPWPLATLWAAQYCYLLAEKLASGGPFLVTDQRQADYFNRVAGEEIVSIGGRLLGQQVLMDLLPALRKCGDGYVQFVLAHQPPDGSVTEQINRETGQPQGAHDLTWAVSELLHTLAMRG
jgi:glucoamylase